MDTIARQRFSVALKTAFHKAWNNLGIAYLETNRFEEAVQCFEKAVDLNPEYSFAQASLAATYIHRNKPKQAIEHLRKAVSLNATLSEAHGNLALAYAMIGKYRGAEQALQQATALGYENWQDVRKRITALQQMDSPQIAMDRPDIQDIIAALAGEPIEEREAAAKSLRDLAKREMSTEEGLLALRAATHEFPPRRYNFLDSSADLIRAAAEQPQFGAAAR